ncbi:MAG: hypothetical protein U5M51_13960 [Emticicia sp.]|nr:hypothetical protein [Emticicia sp.]
MLIKKLRRLLARLLTLRAQFLFELIRNWGDVPAPFAPAYKQTDLFLPQANRDETYAKIIEDPKAATGTSIPWRSRSR